MAITQTQTNLYELKKQCKGLVVSVARRPGSTKLLIGIAWWLLEVLADQPQAMELLARIEPVLKMYASYKRK